MHLRPTRTTQSTPEETDARPDGKGNAWRWAIIHFPCLEGVVPRGQLVMVSEKRHIPEARQKHPDLVLWHEKELALFGDQMESAALDEKAFIAVNRLKLKSRGWFMGVEDGAAAVQGGDADEGSQP